MKNRLAIFLFLFLVIIGNSFGQWQNNLPGNSQNIGAVNKQYTLKEISKAFTDYWAPYNVQGGYYYENGIKTKAIGWKQFKREEWFWEQRVNPSTGEFPSTTSYNEFSKSRLRFGKPSSTMSTANWINLGTSTSAGGYAGIGRINCIAFHPSDPNTYWVGAPSGGIWKTTDNGSSWTCINNGMTTLGVSNIIVPSDYATSNTLYIATGDRDGGSLWTLGTGKSADDNSYGIFKTTNGGSSWIACGITYTDNQNKLVYKILMNPNNNQILIASTTDGIFKSTDGGVTWSQKNPNKFIDMEFNPANPNIVYASSLNYSSGYVFRSSDGGDTWTTTATIAGGRRCELGVSTNDPTVVYLLVANSVGGVLGVYKSTDNGLSFSQVNTNSVTQPGMLGYYTDGSGGNTGQGSYDWCIAVSPVDINTVYIGGITSWKSTDGGLTWTAINNWTGSSSYNKSGVAIVHADKHALEFQNSTTLFEGNDGGIYKSTNGGTTWTDLTNGIIISQVYRIGVSKTNSTMTIAGLQDNGTKLYNGTWKDVHGGDGMECIIDYSSPQYMYATYTNGQIYRNSDGYATSAEVKISDNITGTPSGAWVTPYIIDPSNSAILYAGYDKVWKTTDRGTTWTALSAVLSSSQKLRSFAIAPSNVNTIYTADLGHIWKTNDAASAVPTWTEITGTLPVSSASLTYIAVKADDPSTVWVTFGSFSSGNKVFQSTDGGTTWTNISGTIPNIPVLCIVQETRSTGVPHLFIGTDTGVYEKIGSADWNLFSTGMPVVVVPELEFYYGATQSADRLRAATFGRGLWETPVQTTATKYLVTSNDYNPVAGSIVTIKAQLVDASNNHVANPGQIVTWSKTGTGGSFGSATSTTDTSGLATVQFTVSSTGGTIHTVTATDNSTPAPLVGTSSNITVFSSMGVPTLTAPANTITGISLIPTFTWNAVAGAASYKLYLDTNATFSHAWTAYSVSGTSTSFTAAAAHFPLLNNTTYYWKVTAVNGGVESAASTTFSFSTVPAITPVLSAPLDQSMVYTNSTMFTWYSNSATTGLKFIIQVINTVPTSESSWSSPLFSAVEVNTFHTFTLQSGNTYYWRVLVIRSVPASAPYDYVYYPPYNVYSTCTTTGGTNVRVYPSWPVGDALVYTNAPTAYWYLDLYTVGTSYVVRYSKYSDVDGSGMLNNSDAVNLASTSNLFMAFPTLDAAAKYYWQVQAVYSGGSTSNWSSIASFNTNGSGSLKIPIPSYPTGGITVYTTSPTIYWYLNDASNGLYYDIDIAATSGGEDGVADFSTATVDKLYLQITGRVSGKTYYYKIRSKNVAGVPGVGQKSDWSSEASFVVNGGVSSGYPVLSWPTGNPTVYTCNPNLSWYLEGSYSGITGYTLKWKKADTFPNAADWAAITNSSNSAASGSVSITGAYNTYYTFTNNLTYGGHYFWYVDAGDPSTAAVGEFTVTGGATGTSVELSSPTDGSTVYTTSPTLNWYLNGSSAGLQNYTLMFSQSSMFAGSSPVTQTLTGISGTSKTLTGLVNGSTYYWKVLASFSDGSSTSYTSPQSFVVQSGASATVQPLVGGPNNVIVNTVSPTLSWVLPAKADASSTFEVQLSDNTGFADAKSFTTAKTVLPVDGLIASKNYFWRVRTMSSDGNYSYFSNTGKFGISSSVTAIDGKSNTPTTYELLQNYPNPFNPSTKISYSIPQNAFVNIKVYDVLGREIATLVNEEKSTGTYSVVFNAANLPSGIYIYRIIAGNYVASKKMILVK